MAEIQIREAIIENCLKMNATGLNHGTAGNISVRHGDNMLISPSATAYEDLTPEKIASMPLADDTGAWEGPLKPSTEWRFHRDIMRARPDVGAVVHTHSPFATILSIAHKPIPAIHYMIAAFGGDDIRCSRFACYGTKALSEAALEALEGRNGCLLGNHGMIAVGPNLEKAMWMAVELETLAHQHFHALQIGGGVLLTEAQLEETLEGFATYGLQQSDDAV